MFHLLVNELNKIKNIEYISLKNKINGTKWEKQTLKSGKTSL